MSQNFSHNAHPLPWTPTEHGAFSLMFAIRLSDL
jgi:hypothetical protein